MRAQHYTSIGLTSRVCWDRNSKSRFLHYFKKVISIPVIGKSQHHFLARLVYKSGGLFFDPQKITDSPKHAHQTLAVETLT